MKDSIRYAIYDAIHDFHWVRGLDDRTVVVEFDISLVRVLYGSEPMTGRLFASEGFQLFIHLADVFSSNISRQETSNTTER